MIGIYKIQNKLNGKIYIGQSNNIERRIKEHCYPSRYKNNYPIDVAIHQDGKQNFDFEILEECSLEELNDRETYWISYYESNTAKGYNCNLGGVQFSSGENNGRAKLTEEDIVKIRNIYKNHGSKKSAYELVKDKTSWTNFEAVWQGATWKYIMPEVYTQENKDYYKSGKAVYSNSQYSDEEVMDFRQRYVTMTAEEIYNLTDKRIAYGSFQKILSGGSYTHLPFYKKKIGKWVQPGEDIKVSENRGKNQTKNYVFTDEEINYFRKLYVTQTAKDIYNQNEAAKKVSYTQFEKILQGKAYKHLPYYSKKNKTWIEPEPVSTISESGEQGCY